MRNAAVLLALLAIAAGACGRESAPAAPVEALPPQPPPIATEYAGSAACAECHGGASNWEWSTNHHDRWARTAHALSMRDFTGEESARPFDGEIFVARDIEHRLGPGPWMECEGPGGERGKFRVESVIGVRRIQMFLTTLPGGHVQVLPVFIEVPAKRWFDYTDFIFGGPSKLEVPKDSAYSWYGPHRNYSSRCGMCHVTDFEIAYDPDAGTYASKWKEQAVGCEACHGPGALHAEKWRKTLDVADPIVNPVKLGIERANGGCAMCHSENLLVKGGFRPGDDLYEHFDVTGLEDEKHLYPDGRAKELIHNYIPILESRCRTRTEQPDDPLRCTKCHDPHGHPDAEGRPIPGDLLRPLDDDWICTQCHDQFARKAPEAHHGRGAASHAADGPGGFPEALSAHTHHAPESPGSRCVNCHMPPLVIEGGHGSVRDHTISIPSIENTRSLGLPNACRTCHVLEQPGWEYEHFEAWYPAADAKNHRVALARAIAGGRARRPEAKAALLALLADENPVYRAGAAALLAAYDVDLRPALGDPHPLVRRNAVEGVARLHPEALEPMLDDSSLVLRRAAAIALASRREREDYDYIRARKELRARVVAVLEACIDERNDDADVHWLLSTLYRMDGRTDEANRAHSRFLLLRPWMK